MLDGYRISLKDEEKKNFSRFYPDGYYTYDHLDFTLRDYDSTSMTLFTKDERDIRTSFDSFLDFLAKLEYLFTIQLLSDKEISYFRYFINKAADNEGIVKYVKTYNFQLKGKLHPKLKNP